MNEHIKKLADEAAVEHKHGPVIVDLKDPMKQGRMSAIINDLALAGELFQRIQNTIMPIYKPGVGLAEILRSVVAEDQSGAAAQYLLGMGCCAKCIERVLLDAEKVTFALSALADMAKTGEPIE